MSTTAYRSSPSSRSFTRQHIRTSSTNAVLPTMTNDRTRFQTQPTSLHIPVPPIRESLSTNSIKTPKTPSVIPSSPSLPSQSVLSSNDNATTKTPKQPYTFSNPPRELQRQSIQNMRYLRDNRLRHRVSSAPDENFLYNSPRLVINQQKPLSANESSTPRSHDDNHSSQLPADHLLKRDEQQKSSLTALLKEQERSKVPKAVQKRRIILLFRRLPPSTPPLISPRQHRNASPMKSTLVSTHLQQQNKSTSEEIQYNTNNTTSTPSDSPPDDPFHDFDQAEIADSKQIAAILANIQSQDDWNPIAMNGGISPRHHQKNFDPKKYEYVARNSLDTTTFKLSPRTLKPDEELAARSRFSQNYRYEMLSSANAQIPPLMASIVTENNNSLIGTGTGSDKTFTFRLNTTTTVKKQNSLDDVEPIPTTIDGEQVQLCFDEILKALFKEDVHSGVRFNSLITTSKERIVDGCTLDNFGCSFLTFIVVLTITSHYIPLNHLARKAMSSAINPPRNRLSPMQLYSKKMDSESPPTHLALSSPPPIKHWSQTCHETILSSNDNNHPIQLNLSGGADSGQFVYFNESISLLKNNQTLFTILKGGKIDFDEIIIEIDQHKVAGCTLADVQLLIEKLSINGKQIQLNTVKAGLTKDLRQFLDARFQKGSIDHDLQQTIRDNLYLRTVPCTTRPPRPGEINGQDYTFLSTKDFRALEKSGNLLESGVYKGHYYGTPRPPKEAILTNGQHQYLSPSSNTNLLRRSNSANEMFQQQRTTENGLENNGIHYQYPNNDPEFFNGHSPNDQIFHSSNGDNQLSTMSRATMNENSAPSPPHLSGELISCSLQKSPNGFGFTIIGGNEKGEHFLQIKDILADGPAARDGKLRRGDILVYVNDTNVLGFSHTDVVRIFQSLSINDSIRLTVCRGYPLVVNFDDPQIDVVSVNGVHNSSSIHNLPNGGYTEYQPDSHQPPSLRIHTIKIRKGDAGFGFTVADSPSGQRVKAIVDRQRCQDLCENDLLLSINGQDLIGKQHADVVDILIKCLKDIETTFIIRRGDPDVNNNNHQNNNNTNNNNNNISTPFVLNGVHRLDRNNQLNHRPMINGKHVSFLANTTENEENDHIDTRYPPSKLNEKPRSKTPTPFGSTPLVDALPLRSRTPLPTTTTLTKNHHLTHSTTTDNNNPYDNNLCFLIPKSIDTSTPIIDTDLPPNSMNMFDRQTAWSRSARDVRTTTTNGNGPLLRSKTPGPDFGTTISSSYRANTLMGTKQRSKTPTANDFSSHTLHNSRSLQSVHPQYFELVVNLTLLRPNDGFGLRIVGGEEEKSQVAVGRIVPNTPAYIDGRLRKGDEIIKIDGHSTIRASHERVVQLMQQAKDNQRVSLIVRRYLYPNNTQLSNQYDPNDVDSYPSNDFRSNSSIEHGIRQVTLQKMNDNQSFGFVIISSQNKAGATVDNNRHEQVENSVIHKVWIGKIIPNSPADQCGQLHVNDRILAVNGVDLTHMLHTDVVNLIKDSGRTITLKIGPPIPHDDRSHDMSHPFSTLPTNNGLSNGMRPSSSSPMVIANGNHQTVSHPIPQPINNGHHSIRNAFSHNPLNILERNQNRPPSRANGVLKSSSLSDDYFTVDLQRPYPNSSFGFSIRGGREFSIPLFILKLADNGPAARDGRMKSGDQIIEINGRSTYGMTHNEAISLIRDGGLYVRLLLRKTNAPPPSLDEVKTAMVPMGNSVEYYNPGPSSHWQPSGYT